MVADNARGCQCLRSPNRAQSARTGRAVVATLADHHSDPDTGVLVFLLEPRAA